MGTGQFLQVVRIPDSEVLPRRTFHVPAYILGVVEVGEFGGAEGAGG